MYLRKESDVAYCSTCHIKQQYPLPTSSASDVVIYNWVNGCLIVKVRWSHLKITQAFNPQKQTTAKSSLGKFHQQRCQSEPLIIVYSYHLMLKSVPCMHGGFCLSNPTTNTSTNIKMYHRYHGTK